MEHRAFIHSRIGQITRLKRQALMLILEPRERR